MTEHRQSRITHPSGRRVGVDAGIAPLLKALWAREIETVMSCENIDGKVWIQFQTSRDAERFATLTVPASFEWEYEVFPLWLDALEHVLFLVSIRFPVEEYGDVLEAVQRAV